MAEYQDRYEENAPGRFYVDDTCIDCDQCRQVAPDFFTRQDLGGYSYVKKQPVTPEEVELCEEALDGCPTGTIGNDGPETAAGLASLISVAKINA